MNYDQEREYQRQMDSARREQENRAANLRMQDDARREIIRRDDEYNKAYIKSHFDNKARLARDRAEQAANVSRINESFSGNRKKKIIGDPGPNNGSGVSPQYGLKLFATVCALGFAYLVSKESGSNSRKPEQVSPEIASAAISRSASGATSVDVPKAKEQSYSPDLTELTAKFPGLVSVELHKTEPGAISHVFVGRLSDSSLIAQNFSYDRDYSKPDTKIEKSLDAFLKQNPSIIECEYLRPGSSPTYQVVRYWLATEPAGASREELQKISPEHPLLHVVSQRMGCPSWYDPKLAKF